MKISIILGTRPEIIKMSPIIRECNKRDLNLSIIYTGQHYSFNMSKIFFNQLNLPVPKYSLKINSKTHGKMTGEMMIHLEEALKQEMPDIILVEGDTNSVLAGALVAVKMGIKVGHVEAGLRSYDRNMPEEINRILVDHCSDLLFAPTEKSKNILLKEGISEDKVFVTGNTIVDAVYQIKKLSENKRSILKKLDIKKNEYMLTTIHREENVDNKRRYLEILNSLEKLSKIHKMPIIYPIHPRAEKRVKEFNFEINHLRFIKPLDYLSFLKLIENARLILTDSGGIQEEACILKVPCVTLRYNTERPETLLVGSNILAGTKFKNIKEKADLMLKKSNIWENPFGDGHSSERIIDIVTHLSSQVFTNQLEV